MDEKVELTKKEYEILKLLLRTKIKYSQEKIFWQGYGVEML